MTQLLERAIKAARRLPSASQDEIARAILHLAAADPEPEPIDAAHLSAVLEGLAQAEQREFATDEEIEALFHRLESDPRFQRRIEAARKSLRGGGGVRLEDLDVDN